MGLLDKFNRGMSALETGLLGNATAYNPQLAPYLSQGALANANKDARMQLGLAMLAASESGMGFGQGMMMAQQAAGQAFQQPLQQDLQSNMQIEALERIKRQRNQQKALDGIEGQISPQLKPVWAALGDDKRQEILIASLMPQDGKPTDDMQEYQLAVKEGFPGSFTDYMIMMKSAGATKVSQSVNSGPAGLPDYLKERQKAIATQLTQYEEQADKAAMGVRRLDGLMAQSRKAQLTGALAPGVMGAAEFLRSFGLEIAPEAMTDARTLDSLINQSHMQWVADLGGARGMTDSENKKLAQAIVRVQDSIPARMEVVTLLRDAEKRKYEGARTAIKRKERQLEDIAAGGKGFSEYEDLQEQVDISQYPQATNAAGDVLIFKDGKWQRPNP